LGQKRAVLITHLVMETSVETRIRQMLEKKYGTASATAALDDDGEDKKPAAMVGCIATDKAKVLADEFDLLFGTQANLRSSARKAPKPEKKTGSSFAAVPDNVGSYDYDDDDDMTSAWL